MITIAAPRLVRVGQGARASLPEILGLLGASRPLLVVDGHFRDSDVLHGLADALGAGGAAVGYFHGTVPDPTTASISEGCAEAKAHRADAIVALGGGSAIDTAKAIALLSVHDRTLRDLRAPYRVVETGLPLVAIPTTAGTGSEATRFCLVTDSESGDKMVCIGEGFMPAAALVDYELTLSVPRRVTADTGIDAFTHALEAYVGHKANAVSDLYAEKALVLIGGALPALMDDLSAPGLRADMMLGSYLAGAAFSNSGLALAHGMSAPLGARFYIPHGQSIGLLLPGVTRFSAPRAPSPYARVARLLRVSDSPSDPVAAAAFVSWVDALSAKLAIPTLRDLGVPEAAYEGAIDEMARESPRSGAVGNNPAAAGHDDIIALFRALMA